MIFGLYFKTLCFIHTILMLILCTAICETKKYDEEYTGIYFAPYVKHSYHIGALAPPRDNYTTTEIQVMLEVIMEKFRRVITWGASSKDGEFEPNITYRQHSYVEVYIAEIAAKINSQKGKKVTIVQGLHEPNNNDLSKEVMLAIECAKKANEIFPGTVEGFVFSYILSEIECPVAQGIPGNLALLKHNTDSDFKVGTTMACKELLVTFQLNDFGGREWHYVKAILQMSDFVVCSVDANTNDKEKGAVSAFESVARDLLEIRRVLRKWFSRLQVIGQLQWATEGPNQLENVESMKTYWEMAHQWSTNNTYEIWFREAFDVPRNDSYTGWWRLTDNQKSTQKDGYIEKILVPKKSTNPRTFITATGDSIPVATTTVFENTIESSTSLVTVNSSSASTGHKLTVASTDNEYSIRIMVTVCFTVAVLLVALLGSMVVFMFLKMKSMQENISKKDIRQFIDGMNDVVAASQQVGIETSALQLPYDTSFEIQRDKLKIFYDRILGVGNFGCVFRAVVEYEDGEFHPVALKTTRDGCPPTTMKGLLSEIKILIYIGKHPNIVALMGAYTLEIHRNKLYVATELCSLGSLEGYLRKHAGSSQINTANVNIVGNAEAVQPIYIDDDDTECITFLQLVQWSQEIASGMHYLGTKRVIHADLATRNVLLTSEKTAKISDFGLSRQMQKYNNYVKTQQEPIPWRWMAIESLKKRDFSAKSDVWSFGVTLWEIFSLGDEPYPGLSWSLNFVNLLINGLRLTNPSHATQEIYQVMSDCWSTAPDERPSFGDIHQKMETIIARIDTIRNT